MSESLQKHHCEVQKLPTHRSCRRRTAFKRRAQTRSSGAVSLRVALRHRRGTARAVTATAALYRSRGNESRYLSFNARSELLNSSGERASARRSILPVGISTDPPSPPVLTVVVCLLKMVARYRPGSFGWMQMHRQHGSTKPKYNPQTSGSQGRGSPTGTH